jgi:hypothetical protein
VNLCAQGCRESGESSRQSAATKPQISARGIVKIFSFSTAAKAVEQAATFCFYRVRDFLFFVFCALVDYDLLNKSKSVSRKDKIQYCTVGLGE